MFTEIYSQENIVAAETYVLFRTRPSRIKMLSLLYLNMTIYSHEYNGVGCFLVFLFKTAKWVDTHCRHFVAYGFINLIYNKIFVWKCEIPIKHYCVVTCAP